ncbi:MAG: YodL domain-containing protein [Oscillospiraceae bacterium]
MRGASIEKNIIIYYGNPAGYLTNGKAVVDPLFQSEELSAFLSRQKDITEVKWTDGVYDRLVNGQRDHPEAPLLKNCRVWQLKPESDVRMRFITLTDYEKGFGSPQRADYQAVFDGEVETNDLEALYTKFNVNHPPGYAGHSLSMSDVLELYDDSGSTYHYCDRFGFKEIAFEPPAQTQAMQL